MDRVKVNPHGQFPSADSPHNDYNTAGMPKAYNPWTPDNSFFFLGPEVPVPITEWKRYVDDVFSIIPKGKRDILLNYLNSIDPHIKFTVEQPNAEGAIPFLDTFPQPKGENISVSVYRKPTHTDRYLDFNSSHPISAKKAVVRALMDRAENVCSDPDILVKEIEHLGKVLRYNNYSG